MQKRIGFAGLGLMGSRMAENLLKKGFPLTFWNRTRERCAALHRAGARIAETPFELAERNPRNTRSTTGRSRPWSFWKRWGQTLSNSWRCLSTRRNRGDSRARLGL